MSIINWLEENWKLIFFIVIVGMIIYWIVDPYIHPGNYYFDNGSYPPPPWCSGPYCD